MSTPLHSIRTNEYKYVALSSRGANFIGEDKGKKTKAGDVIFEPTLDQLTQEGWRPFREVVVSDHWVLIILERERPPG